MAWIEMMDRKTVINSDKITAMHVENIPNKQKYQLLTLAENKVDIVTEIPYEEPSEAGIKARKILLNLAGIARSNALIKQDDIEKMLED